MKQKRLAMINRQKERETKVKTLLSHALNMSKRRDQRYPREINRNNLKFEKQFPWLLPYFLAFHTSVQLF